MKYVVVAFAVPLFYIRYVLYFDIVLKRVAVHTHIDNNCNWSSPLHGIVLHGLMLTLR